MAREETKIDQLEQVMRVLEGERQKKEEEETNELAM